jgi:ATP-dependent RNA helicase RhlE
MNIRHEPDRTVKNSMDKISSTGFGSLGLMDPLLEALARLGHTQPTPIQNKAIGPALAGRDVLGSAQTGTGKTAAFALPILQRLCQTEDTRGTRVCAIRALIMSPTRELAAQIDESFEQYGAFCDVRHAVVFGGVGQASQVRELRRGLDVLVATPGRLEDLLNQGLVDLGAVEVLVLDEVDRMLDQGFLPAVRRIAARTPKQRQTLLFSATMPRELRKLALDLTSNPIEVSVDPEASTPDAIEQVVYHVGSQQKRQMLEHLVKGRDMDRVLVFTRTKHGADRVARNLKTASIAAEALHGGKTQSTRERALMGFRNGTLRVLVATDLAARGIHIDGISHVINFDLPVDADNYVHRIGRTARAGATGMALSLCTAEERDVLQRIEKLIQRRIPAQQTPELPALPPVQRQQAQRDAAQVQRSRQQLQRDAAPAQRPRQQPQRDAAQAQRPRQQQPQRDAAQAQRPRQQQPQRDAAQAQRPRQQQPQRDAAQAQRPRQQQPQRDAAQAQRPRQQPQRERSFDARFASGSASFSPR